MMKLYDFIENQSSSSAKFVFMHIDEKAKYIFKNKDETVKWSDSEPIKIENEFICSLNSNSGSLGKIKIHEFEDKDWTECIIVKETPKKDWIGCLCWFYNDEEIFYKKYLGTLARIECSDTPYVSNTGSRFKCVEPAKRTDFKFLEDYNKG